MQQPPQWDPRQQPVTRPPAPLPPPPDDFATVVWRTMATVGRWIDEQLAREVPSRFMRWLIYSAAVLVLIALSCATLEALATNAQNAQTGTPLPAVTQPSAPPTATPTSAAAHLISGATLGGTAAAFDAVLGPRVDAETWSTSIGGQPAYLMIATQPGTDGSERAASIVIGPPPELLATETWDLATLSSYAQRLLPSDATPAGTESGPNGTTVHDLHSDQLTATFPAATFTNDPGTRQVAPGSLNWSCYLASPQGGNGVNQCQISVGTYR